MQAGSKGALLALIVVALGVGAFFVIDGAGGEGALPTEVVAGAEPEQDGALGAAMQAVPGEALGVAPTAGAAAPRAERTELAAAAAAPHFALTGRLVDPSGEPVGGVAIRCAETMVMDLPAFAPPEAGSGQEKTTDAEGRFRFVMPAGKAGRLSLPGGDWVFAKAAGEALAVAIEADRDLGDVPLARAATLSGLVRDRAGRQLAGVEVSLAFAGRTGGVPGFARYRTETDEAGRFAFAGLRGAKYRLTTASPRHLPGSEEVELAMSAALDDVVLTLDLGASIWGRVTDDLGAPIQGATVGAYRTRDMGEGMQFSGLSSGESVQTDANGKFELGGIEGDAVTVRARADGHRTTSQGEVRKGTGDLVMVMPRHARVEGLLVDQAGQPIAGSKVRAVPVSRSGLIIRRGGGVTTGADGTFALDDVEPGAVTIEAEGDDHVTAATKVTVRPGSATQNVRLVAARGASIEVTVVDPSGDPVAGATVEVKEVAGSSQGSATQSRSFSRRVERRVEDGHEDVVFDDGSPRVIAEGRTGPDGRARIGGLPAGMVELLARHELLAPSRASQLALASSGTADATLTLRQGGAVELTVVDANLAVLPDAKVVVEGPEAAGEASESRSGKSDAEGVLRLGPLPAGSYTAALQLPSRPMTFGGGAIVLAQGGTLLEGSHVPFVVRSGETVRAKLVHPVLTTLSGTLRDNAGAVVGGRVEVHKEGELRLPGSATYSATTGDDGRFSIEGLPAGSYKLVYGRSNQIVKAEAELELQNEREIERHLVLTGGSIRMTVMDGDGEPLRRAQVTVSRASASGGASGSRPARFAMVTIEADGQGGVGEQSMTLGGAESTVYTDVDGVALIEDVPSGKYKVAIEHSQHVDKSVEAEVAGDSARDIGRVQLAFGGSLRGKLTTEGGDALMIATVEIQRAGAEDWRSTTAMRGSFRFTGLEPGRYRVRARRMPMGASPAESPAFGPIQEVDVEAGEAAHTTVRVE